MAYKISYVIHSNNTEDEWIAAFDNTEDANTFGEYLETKGHSVTVELDAMCIFDNANEAINHKTPEKLLNFEEPIVRDDPRRIPSFQMVKRTDNLYDLLVMGVNEHVMTSMGVDHDYCQRLYNMFYQCKWEFFFVPEDEMPFHLLSKAWDRIVVQKPEDFVA